MLTELCMIPKLTTQTSPIQPSESPSSEPSSQPSSQPSSMPSESPSSQPSSMVCHWHFHLFTCMFNNPWLTGQLLFVYSPPSLLHLNPPNLLHLNPPRCHLPSHHQCLARVPAASPLQWYVIETTICWYDACSVSTWILHFICQPSESPSSQPSSVPSESPSSLPSEVRKETSAVIVDFSKNLIQHCVFFQSPSSQPSAMPSESPSDVPSCEFNSDIRKWNQSNTKLINTDCTLSYFPNL